MFHISVRTYILANLLTTHKIARLSNLYLSFYKITSLFYYIRQLFDQIQHDFISFWFDSPCIVASSYFVFILTLLLAFSPIHHNCSPNPPLVYFVRI